jgi:hypothetical protein
LNVGAAFFITCVVAFAGGRQWAGITRGQVPAAATGSADAATV